MLSILLVLAIVLASLDILTSYRYDWLRTATLAALVSFIMIKWLSAVWAV